MEKIVIGPQDGWSVEHWLTLLYNGGTLSWVIGGVVAAFLIIYLLFRTPKS